MAADKKLVSIITAIHLGNHDCGRDFVQYEGKLGFFRVTVWLKQG
ncbi:MAG: hypothetical protein CENE_00595 [Candidatus Celerinatantimonas neptuna]|nr:MAG: hypothetical protein CENE_00595 [Candidatus Celerinatantimonas neptuna]